MAFGSSIASSASAPPISNAIFLLLGFFLTSSSSSRPPPFLLSAFILSVPSLNILGFPALPLGSTVVSGEALLELLLATCTHDFYNGKCVKTWKWWCLCFKFCFWNWWHWFVISCYVVTFTFYGNKPSWWAYVMYLLNYCGFGLFEHFSYVVQFCFFSPFSCCICSLCQFSIELRCLNCWWTWYCRCSQLCKFCIYIHGLSWLCYCWWCCGYLLHAFSVKSSPCCSCIFALQKHLAFVLIIIFPVLP